MLRTPASKLWPAVLALKCLQFLILSVVTDDGYRLQEFIRIGYYVNNEYWEEELRESPPERPLIDR